MVKKYSDLYLDARKALLPGGGAATGGAPGPGAAVRRLREKPGGDSCPGGTSTPLKRSAGPWRTLPEEPWQGSLWPTFWRSGTLWHDPVCEPDAHSRDDTCAVTELALKKALFLSRTHGFWTCAPARLHRPGHCQEGEGCQGHPGGCLPGEALVVAKKNAAAMKLTGRVSCIQADARQDPSAFLGTFDLIVSNPPYVRSGDLAALQPSVRDFEPILALDGGAGRPGLYRSIASRYGRALKPGGWLCLEFGMGQGDAVCAILERNGYEIVERKKDFNEIERAVLARKRREEEHHGNEESCV